MLCTYCMIRTCPVESPTTRSAIKVSSVSPERWDTMVPQPFDFAKLWALIDSVTVPIWFTFNKRQLQAFFSTAVLILEGFVTVKSSPTICNDSKKRALSYIFNTFKIRHIQIKWHPHLTWPVSHICDTAQIDYLHAPSVKPRCKHHNTRHCNTCSCRGGIKFRQ